MRSDLRYALRVLKRSPAFASVAILSLALGIGANAAIFTIVNAVLLRPLPVDDPTRLVRVMRMTGDRPSSLSYPLFETIRERLTTVSGSFATMTAEQPITIDGDEEMVSAELVSGGYFGVLGMRAAAGRVLDTADDAVAPAAPAAVISDAYWQRRFGRSASAIGKAVTVLGRPFTIVGVVPATFRSVVAGRHPDLFLPLHVAFTSEQLRSSGFNSLSMLARLRPGATAEQTDAEIQVIYRDFLQSQVSAAPANERPATVGERAVAVRAPNGVSGLVDQYRQSLAILMGIVTLVLLLACVNLSGLLLARAAARQREISIRLAMGAGRARLIRQFLVESVFLAGAGGVLGLTMSVVGGPRLLALLAGSRDLAISVAPDWRVVSFTGVVSALACVLVGLAPAVQSLNATISGRLKETVAGGSRRLGHVLVGTQLALSTVLLVGASLFIGTFLALNRVDRGFDADGVLVVTLANLHPSSDAAWKTTEATLLDRLAALPGVSSSSVVQLLPLTGRSWDRTVQIEGPRGTTASESVGFNVIGPRYFFTMGTPMLAGREFDAQDTATAPKAAIVNERFAAQFFGKQSALGRRVTAGGVTYEIVGMAADARSKTVRESVVSTMYIAQAQRSNDQPAGYSYLLRVATGEPERLAPAIDRIVRDVHPALRVRRARAYAAIIDDSVDSERTLAVLGGFFGALALLVAGIGVFGLLAFQVARRTREFGIRLALGAGKRDVTALVLREVTVVTACGLSAGGAAALATAGVARSVLFGVTPDDPRVFAAAAVVLSAVAFAAAWLPARAAARVDPLVALRHD